LHPFAIYRRYKVLPATCISSPLSKIIVKLSFIIAILLFNSITIFLESKAIILDSKTIFHASNTIFPNFYNPCVFRQGGSFPQTEISPCSFPVCLRILGSWSDFIFHHQKSIVMPRQKVQQDNQEATRADLIFQAACGCYSFIGFERADFDKFLQENPTFIVDETSSFILDKFQDYLLASGDHEVMA
jgi:hypothetical protein